MAPRSPLINVMIRAAEKAGKALIRDFGEVEQLQVSRKGPSDYVSAADQKSETILREELGRARPDFGFIMEESGKVEGVDATTRWIIDPLDGTTNFLHGIPHWAISIAVEHEGDIIAGLIYAPIADEMFWCEKGNGVFSNAKRLRVSSRRDLGDALVATSIPFRGHGKAQPFINELTRVMLETSGIRRQGCASLDLAYVASGRLDAFWARDLHLWDIAAGAMMVTEAGGFVSEIGGGRAILSGSSLVATNAYLQLPFNKLLAAASAPSAS